MHSYKFDKNFLFNLQQNQLIHFENDFRKTTQEHIYIDYKERGYKVNNTKEEYNTKTQTIGIFSGAGGLDIGAQLAKSKVIASLDFDADSIATIKTNKFFNHTKHILKDIQQTTANDFEDILKKNNPEKLILVGGPPCQPFSKAGYWVTHKNRKGSKDPRNMIEQYLRIINELQPDGFLLENVESLLHPKNVQAVLDLEEAIDKLGYNFIKYRANALQFGVPQKRKRVFFIASRKKIKYLPILTHGNEKEIVLNPELLPYENVIDWIGKFDTFDLYEKEEVTSGKTYSDELMAVPPGKNYIALTEKAGYPNPKFIANKRFWNFLLKLHPYQPSWTIAAQPGPWVGPFHWTGRRLRTSEIAAIQTFPEDYIFYGNRRSIQKQIGNAVPPLLGKAIIENLLKNI